MEPTDTEDLMRRSQAGDPAALELLLQRHLPGVRAFVRVRMSPLLRAHESSADLVQSTCRALLVGQSSFEYRGEAAFRAWLYTAALGKLRKHERDLRRQKRDARRLVADGHGLAECYASVLSPSRQAIADEEVRALEAAFDDLPEHYREVIALSRFARLTHAQVGEQMGRTEDSVRNLLHRALATLAEAIERQRRGGDC